MKLFGGLLCFVSKLLLCSSLIFPTLAQLRDNGKTTTVQWDHNSLVINSHRTAIFSGEFHYPRLPVPSLWPDIFQKMRASGFNTVSIYFFWSYHASAPPSSPDDTASIDITTHARNIQLLLDQAQAAGLWVVARAGPYINAETNAGGIALWTTTGAFGQPRTNDTAFRDAWLPWITAVGEVFAANGVDKGGPIILVQHENEYDETVHEPDWQGVLYMEQIAAAYEAAGVKVPSTHNEKGMRAMSWSTDFQNVGGAVDVYGLDSYPNGFNCRNPDGGFSVVRSYYNWFQVASPTQPEWMPEYQGGSFDPWGGFGYDSCAKLTGTEFVDVFYKTLIAQMVRMVSLYMTYGGTNWGGLAAPVVYTSYDYGAPLSEGRVVRDKMRQTKLLGLFLRVSTGLLEASMVGNTTLSASSGSVYSTHLRNPNDNAGFYWVVKNTTSSRDAVTFDLPVLTSRGNQTIQNIQLSGRQSKFVVTDYQFGSAHTLLYSSAEVLTYATFPDRTALVLYLDQAQTAEFVLKDVASAPTVHGDAPVQTDTAFLGSNTRVTYTQTPGKTVLEFGPELQIWLVDRIAAWNLWAPVLTTDPFVTASDHLLVAGDAYLVRTAALDGSTAHLTGDTNSTTTLEVAAPGNITALTWNGADVSVSASSYGTLLATIPGPAVNISSLLPDLAALDWRSADSLPERFPEYDDANWTLADHNSTANPQQPETLPVLYPDDYGFHVGHRLYRGRFSVSSPSSAPTSVTLRIIGGTAFGFSAFLNGDFLGSFAGNASVADTTLTLPFTNTTAQARDGENVLLVLHDDAGHGEDSEAGFGTLNPRGILRASLSDGSTTFTSWRLTGNAGGEHPVDSVRGIFNEGGLHGERLGWHLPSFPTTTSSWNASSPLTGVSTPGVQFYVANFTLALPHSLDTPLSLRLPPPSTTDTAPARIQLYVNGWQLGKYLPHVGPQNEFPLPPGVLDTSGGTNTLALAVWAMTRQGARLDAVELVASEGSYGSALDWAQVVRVEEGLRAPYVQGEREGFA